MRSVYVIDDDTIHQRIAQIIIEKNNLFDELSCYTHAAEALDKLGSNQAEPSALPDVILLDLNMPVVNGWDFLQAYSQLAPGLGKTSDIYIVSSSVDENDKLRAYAFPFVKGFISKPISSDLLNAYLKDNKPVPGIH